MSLAVLIHSVRETQVCVRKHRVDILRGLTHFTSEGKYLLLSLRKDMSLFTTQLIQRTLIKLQLRLILIEFLKLILLDRNDLRCFKTSC